MRRTCRLDATGTGTRYVFPESSRRAWLGDFVRLQFWIMWSALLHAYGPLNIGMQECYLLVPSILTRGRTGSTFWDGTGGSRQSAGQDSGTLWTLDALVVSS